MKGAVTTLVENDTDSVSAGDLPADRVEEGAIAEDRTEPENAEELATTAKIIPLTAEQQTAAQGELTKAEGQ